LKTVPGALGRGQKKCRANRSAGCSPRGMLCRGWGVAELFVSMKHGRKRLNECSQESARI
jgi:hypothetical protein